MAGPLDGVRIVDFTLYQQGPYATVMLADMGAEVIKVERREGERTRSYASWTGVAFYANNRRKRSIALDARSPQGRAIVLRLAERSHALVHNFRPGVMERLGLGYDDVREANEAIVYARASGWGAVGPRAKQASVDLIAQAAGGMMSRTGFPGDPPLPLGAAVADQLGAIHLCSAILAGVVRAARTGEGSQAEVSLFGSQIAAQSRELAAHAIGELPPGRAGSGEGLRNAGGVSGAFATADGWIALAADASALPRLRQAVDAPAPAEREPPADGGEGVTDKVVAALRSRLPQRPSGEWVTRLAAAGIAAAPVRDYAAILADPHARANGYIVEVDHPAWGRRAVVGSPIVYDGAPRSDPGLAPEVGESTELLLEELGYGWDEIAALRAAAVI
jgi:crotonobetainyl-CoA:carnitine CoA-transferase CaiB-like acyl-CoA transferase